MLGYCVSVRVLARVHMCVHVYRCVSVCVYVCKGVTVILPVTRCTQSRPVPPAFLRSSFYHLRVEPGQTGSEVQRRERSEPEGKFTQFRQGSALCVAGWGGAREGGGSPAC